MSRCRASLVLDWKTRDMAPLNLMTVVSASVFLHSLIVGMRAVGKYRAGSQALDGEDKGVQPVSVPGPRTSTFIQGIVSVMIYRTAPTSRSYERYFATRFYIKGICFASSRPRHNTLIGRRNCAFAESSAAWHAQDSRSVAPSSRFIREVLLRRS